MFENSTSEPDTNELVETTNKLNSEETKSDLNNGVENITGPTYEELDSAAPIPESSSDEVSSEDQFLSAKVKELVKDENDSVLLSEENTVNSEVSNEQLADQIEDESTILERAKMNESKKNTALINLNDLNLQIDNLQLKIEEIVSVREDLSQWTEARKESFAWRLIESLRKYESTLVEDEKAIKNFSENPPDLDIDFTSKIRKWILRSLGLGLLFMFGLGYLVEMVRKYSDFINVADPANPANSIQVNAIDFELNNSLGLDHIQLQFIFAFIFLLYSVGILFAYSRKTSEFRQIVAVEAHKTKIIEREIHTIKDARERIDSLHPQVPQILELLSLGLHRPWEISNKYQNFKGDLPDASRIPECLDIAVPTEKSASRIFSKLVLQALNQLQIPGWREKAFNNSIQGLAQMAGFGESDSALKEIDQDQRRNGKRQMLINLENKESVLNSIGDRLVAEFAAEVQEKVLPLAQPDVISLRPDELAGLSLADSLVQIDEENVSQWELKLAEISGASSPWAPATFSSRGQIAAKHESKPESVLIATDRVCQNAHKEVGQFNEVYPGTRPFEVSIRVDLSPWCHPEEIAIFQDYQPTAEELELRNEREFAQSPKSLEIDQNLDEVAF
jgi:hypothetical protein